MSGKTDLTSTDKRLADAWAKYKNIPVEEVEFNLRNSGRKEFIKAIGENLANTLALLEYTTNAQKAVITYDKLSPKVKAKLQEYMPKIVEIIENISSGEERLDYLFLKLGLAAKCYREKMDKPSELKNTLKKLISFETQIGFTIEDLAKEIGLSVKDLFDQIRSTIQDKEAADLRATNLLMEEKLPAIIEMIEELAKTETLGCPMEAITPREYMDFMRTVYNRDLSDESPYRDIKKTADALRVKAKEIGLPIEKVFDKIFAAIRKKKMGSTKK